MLVTPFRSVLTAFAFLSLVGLSACGGGGGDEETPPTETPTSPQFFSVGGTVTGLDGVAGLVLRRNGTEEIAIGNDGAFRFPVPLTAHASYVITVAALPPGRMCTLRGATGTVVAAEISNIEVVCSSISYAISGSAAGLAAGDRLTLQNNGTDSVVVTEGAFVFPVQVAHGGSYSVTVAEQPRGKACSVARYRGVSVNAAVTDVQVTCSTITHTVAGTVSGLLSATALVLENNAGDPITVSSNGSFVFPTSVPYGGSYAVTVASQPRGQTCAAGQHTGVGMAADVTNIVVTCATNAYAIGGRVSGLTGALVLQNGADTLSVSADGTFSLPTRVPFGGSYSVTVLAQPSGQSCAVANNAGVRVESAVLDLLVTCSTNTYTVGGSVSGLRAGQHVSLANNGGDPITLAANGTFVFQTPVPFGANYTVSVTTQPVGQTCSVARFAGSAISHTVTDVAVTCATNAYGVSGSVTGLSGGTLVLQNNGTNPTSITANGTFQFSTPVAFGSTYMVSVLNQPLAQRCTVTDNSGTVASAVTNVMVTCAAADQFAYLLTIFPSSVEQFRIGADGGLVLVGSLPIQDANSIVADRSGRNVYVHQLFGSDMIQYGVVANGTLQYARSLRAQSPGTGVIDSQNRMLYSINRISNDIEQVNIVSGTSAGLIGTGDEPSALVTDPLGRYAYLTDAAANTVTTYPLATNGAMLSPIFVSPTGRIPTAAVLYTPPVVGVESLYVLNQDDATVSQYALSPDGSLHSTAQVTALPNNQALPLALAVHRRLPYLYVLSMGANGSPGEIAQYRVGAFGELQPLSPATVPTGPWTQDISISPFGQYLYAANEDSVSQFAIGADGRLSLLPTPPVPITGGGSKLITLTPN